MQMTTEKLIRWAGLSAAAAGVLFIAVQMLHPHEVLPAVTTVRWAVVHGLTVTMCMLGLFGITGLYTVQVKESGWLGLVGYVMFSCWFLLAAALTFAEACILPLLATEAPRLAEGFLALSSGRTSEVDLGALAVVGGPVSAVLYLLGGLLFGLALVRARVISRGAAILFACGAVASLAAAVLPHDLARIAAVPMGLGLVWTGYSLRSRRGRAEQAKGGIVA
ncbi:hypothetical protein B5M42_014410 [Paenibacillus athensensis]|uniref:DUF4386 family protein n=1 Tax=Paenibacillus athensensis TaxID=1967502 RepID=A0A4Y8Q8H9_9BACL|nr:hypothetical protein [Paenibacillus athensensis]MCD1260007.1 hypothetical protein [Paenibacillus athensensis]